MQERWRDIEGYEGVYSISNLGNIRSKERAYTNKRGDKRKYPSALIKPWLHKNGYYYVTLKNKGFKRNFTLHRLLAKAFIPTPDSRLHINHKDGNRSNFSLSNLEWMTIVENNRHQASYLREHQGWKKHLTRNKTIRYQCRINACGTHVSLGLFDTKQECQKVFAEAYKEFYGVTPKLKAIS